MNRFSRSAVVSAPRRIAIERRPLPEVGPDQVRVRLEGCGVCGSNLPVWEGRPWFSYPFAPGAPGHEGWGRIDTVGDRVENFLPGDRVAILSYNAYAEYDVADAAQTILLPAALDSQPFPAEALGCAMNIFRRSEIGPGDDVAIVGVGFVGALLVNLAARAGARVIAISRRPFALSIAQKMGAREVLALNEVSQVVGAVKELTLGRGCARVIEATGLQQPLDLAGELTAERGRLIIAGYHQDGLRQVNMQLWNWRGLDVINAHERDPRVYLRGMQEAAEAVREGRFDPAPLYTDRFRLDELPLAFERMGERPAQFLKGLVLYD